MIATTGFFDGVHLGHRAVLQRVVDMARAQGRESAVITFWPHPRVILHHDAEKVRLLNSLDEKKMRLYQLGIEHVQVIPFTQDFSQLSLEQFFQTYLQQQFHVETLIVGYDHRLGHKAGTDYKTMKKIGERLNIAVECIDAVIGDEGIISSTKIRHALREGDIALANRSLGYAYQLNGVVVEGNHVGRTMNFPTANMQLYEPLKQIPANGVYAVRVQIGERKFGGMTNIGIRPTLQQNAVKTIETHIFDFSEDIYGQNLTIEFIARIRDEQQFASLDALKEQLGKDKLQSLCWLQCGEHTVEKVVKN